MESDKLYECMSSKDDLVGVEFTKDIPNVYLPLGYHIPSGINENEKINCIYDILQTLSLCTDDGSFENYDFNSDNANVIPINSYLWIINDYLKNGLYNVYEKKYIESQKGKVNWKRTLKTKAIYDNEEIYYLNPITEIKTKYDNIITEIHAICVNRSIEKIGWLFGKIPLVEVVSTCDDNTYLDILNNELVKSFNDNKKTLIRHLINIMRKKIDNDELDVVNNLLTKKYNVAWEKMIDSVFGNVSNKEDFFPEIVWKLRDNNKKPNIMRPDTIIEKEKKIYIVDAKYYTYGVEKKGSLPGAADIDKQLTYGEYNVYKQKNENVYNAFILPFCRKENEDPIKTIGTVKSVGRDKDHLYENIVILLMDTKYLIDLYYNKNGINDRLSANRLLIDSILNEIKLLKKEKRNS